MILLLTGCINPQGMSFTVLSDKEKRKDQYIKAITFYLEKTKHPVVFVENSGTDISQHFEEAIVSKKLECLTFEGNKNKKRGKGAGECEIIEYALNHSETIKASKQSPICKITGRLFIKNINTLLLSHRFCFSTKKTVFFSINSDLSFPDSRFIIAPIPFWNCFLKDKDKINDSEGYYFEHAILNCIIQEKQFAYSPFFISPEIEGMSGSTGHIYSEPKKGFIFTYRFLLYTISQRRRFYRLFR